MKISLPKRAKSLSVLKRTSLVYLLVLGCICKGWSQAVDDYRTRTGATGNWTSTTIWQRFNGTNWVNVTTSPTSSNGAIEVASDASLTVTSGISVDQLTINGIVTYSAASNGAGNAFTVANGLGTDMVINGTFVHSGSGNQTNLTMNGTWAVNAGGKYVHNSARAISAALDNATLDPLSTFEYRGSSSLTPASSFTGRTYGNLLVTSTSGNLTLTGTGASGITINGDVTVGTGVTLGLSGIAGTRVINGNVNLSGVFTSFPFTLASGKALTLNLGGSLSAAGVITYAAGSSLIYNAGGTVGRSNEWTATTGAGYPYNIRVSNNTTLNLGNGGTATARQCANNLTIDAGATLSMNVTGSVMTAALSVLGDLNNNGTLILSGSSGGNINIGGNWTESATATFISNSRTVTLNGSGLQTISRTGGGTMTFPTLSIVKTTSSQVSLANNTVISNDLTLNSLAGVLSIGSNTLTISGTLTRTSGTITANLGTITFDGNTAQSAPVGVFTSNTVTNLNIFNTVGVIFSSGISVSGTMTVNGLFIPPAAGVIDGAGTLTGIGTIQVTNNSGLNNLSTQYSLTRSLNNLTVEYIGTSAQSADATTYGTLKISNANGVSLNGNTSTGALNLNTGNLSIGTNTLTINGAVTRTSGNLAGSITSNLIIGGVAGSLYFDQSGTNNFLRTFTINNASSATLGNRLVITSFDGASEGVVTVNGSGTLSAGGLLLLRSDANGTARVAQGNAAGGYISGSVIVERFIPQNASKAWRLLASNTIGQTINNAWQQGVIGTGSGSNPLPGYGTMIAGKFTSLALAQAAGYDTLSASGSLLRYDAATDSLIQVGNTNATNINSEQGYFIYIRGDRSPNQFGASTTATTSTTLRSLGLLYQGDQPVSNVAAGQYALLRNPYASAIDLRNVTIGGGLVDAYQIWDPVLAGSYGLGGYQTLTRFGDHYSITPGGGSFGADSIVNTIQSGAAFFVQATGTAGTIQINETSKVGGSRLVFRPASPLATPTLLKTNLYYVNGASLSLADGNAVYFDESFSNDFTQEDVKKGSNFGEDFAMVKSGTDLVIEKRMLPTTNDSVMFSMRRLKRASYKLEIKSDAGLPGMYATLEDKFNGNSVPLNLTGTTTYDFSVTTNTASSAIDRFKIVFKPAVVLPVTFTNIKAAQVNKDISVEWKVANQVGIAKYDVEKSTNGRSFAAVNSQTASQSTAGELTYNWLDKNATAGANYYRIKSTDLNGKTNYTGIAKVVLNQKGSGVGLYPNPLRVKESLTIQLLNQPAGTYLIKIVNLSGQEISKQTLQHSGGSASQNLATPNILSKGMYHVQVIGKDKLISTQKLVIENE